MWFHFEKEAYVVALENNVIVSPNYGPNETYPSMTCCSWTITVPEGKVHERVPSFEILCYLSLKVEISDNL